MGSSADCHILSPSSVIFLFIISVFLTYLRCHWQLALHNVQLVNDSEKREVFKEGKWSWHCCLPDVTEKNHKKLYLIYSESSNYLKRFSFTIDSKCEELERSVSCLL